jgi:hypothetical protein
MEGLKASPSARLGHLDSQTRGSSPNPMHKKTPFKVLPRQAKRDFYDGNKEN